MSDHAVPHAERLSSRVIAADLGVGLQPWTLGGFDPVDTTTTPTDDRRIRPDHPPTLDDVSAIEDQARDEGYRAGLAEAREGSQRVASMLADVSTAIARMEREMAATLVQVAVDLARQIVRESIAVRPEIVIPLVSDALSGIARTVDPGAVYVHPTDLAIVEERLGDALVHAGWRPFADASIERGGCRLEFAGGQVDATVATRWRRVMAQLERDDAWLV